MVVGVYGILSSYDYLSFRFLRIRGATYPGVLIRAFICYAFNLNLGALVGGLAFRFRLYSQWNVPSAKIPKIILFSTLTNWSGYLLILALIFLLKASELQWILKISDIVIRTLGGVILSLLSLYLFMCWKGWELTFKGQTWKVPTLPTALFQLFLSAVQWTLQSWIIFFLLKNLGGQTDYSKIIFTFMVTSIAGVVTHVPAGLGVMEVIFLRMRTEVADSKMLVALLVYRAIYYLIPLLVALPLYLLVEVRKKKLP